MASHTEVLEHLGYEWWMFREACELVRCAGPEDSAERNSFVESLAIHGRALIEFFYLEGSNHWNLRSLGKKPLGHNQLPEALRHWRKVTGSYVAHLTEARMEALVALDIRPVRTHLARCMSNLEADLAAEIPQDWIGKRPTIRRCAEEVGTIRGLGATGARA